MLKEEVNQLKQQLNNNNDSKKTEELKKSVDIINSTLNL